MADPKKLTRKDLSEFLPNQRAIRAFEQLFDLIPSELTENLLQSGTANSKADAAISLATTIRDVADNALIQSGNALSQSTEAISAINRLADSIDSLSLSQPVEKNNSIKADYIDLPVDLNVVNKERRINWNNSHGTLELGLYNDSVLKVGQETVYYVKNASGATISKGGSVMFSSVDGTAEVITVAKAVANGSALPDYMMGIAKEEISNNAFGYVTAFGLVDGIRTDGAPYGEAWNEGDLIYFSTAAPGNLTKVQPQAPKIKTPIAVVVKKSSSATGSLFVRMSVNESMKRLQDVQINSLLGKDFLAFSAANLRWENVTPQLAREKLGLGPDSTVSNGSLLIGNGTDYDTNTLTNGGNIGITNSSGNVSIRVGGNYNNGTLLIGNGSSYSYSTLTAGSNISIANGVGSITISVTGLGSMAFQNTGVTGSFTTTDGKTVTVTNGVVTNIV